MQKIGFSTEMIFCGISFSAWLSNHAVCKIWLNEVRAAVHKLYTNLAEKNVYKRHIDSRIMVVALPEYFSVPLSLLNLLENSLGRSKPATRLMQAQ
jgi:hypothetical protein